MYWKTKWCVACFIAIFTILWWSGTKTAVSPRYACNICCLLFFSLLNSRLQPSQIHSHEIHPTTHFLLPLNLESLNRMPQLLHLFIGHYISLLLHYMLKYILFKIANKILPLKYSYIISEYESAIKTTCCVYNLPFCFLPNYLKN